MKKIIVNIFSCILSLLLTVTIFFTFVCISIGVNVNSKALNKFIISSGYSKSMSNKILTQLYYYADINGLPHNIFDDFVDLDFISGEIYDYIVSVSKNENKSKYIADINNKKIELEAKIKEYAIANMNLTELQKSKLDKDVSDFVEQCANVYINGVKSDALKAVSSYIKITDKYFVKTVFLLILADLIILFILIFIQKWKHRGYRNSLYSLIASEIMLAVLVGLILFFNVINRIPIISKELYCLVTNMLNGCLTTLYVSVAILAILIIINIVVYVQSRKKVM